jgi:putative MATE family efflux protein
MTASLQKHARKDLQLRNPHMNDAAPAKPDAAATGANVQARFVTGSILRHVIFMTMTGALGLMAMFAVDLADLYFLSLLNDTNVTAAIGFAGTIAFANLSMALGIGIASAALVARNLGARNPDRARDFATSTMLFALVVSAAYSIFIALFAGTLLDLLGAKGEALELGKLFIWTVTPGFVLLAVGVSCSFSLRGLGDPTRAMYITLSMAVITAIFDPIMIFWFGLGIQGAAVANVIAYAGACLIGLHGLARVHKFLKPPSFAALRRDFREIWAIAFPSILTQLATPFAAAYTTYAIAPYGNEAVAASAIIGRIVPVAFGVIFALSGSVGPIIGQNFGAKDFGRVRQTLYDGLRFSAVYTLITAGLLFIFRHELAGIFLASGRIKELIEFFCTFVAISWAFAGAQFVANAAFNNLGRAALSSWFNWAKATIGTIPFAMVGAAYGGAEGLIAGIAVGSIIFGIASVAMAYKIVGHLEPKAS